jgi:hypothetical protein
MRLRDMPGKLWSRLRGSSTTQQQSTDQYTTGLPNEYYTNSIIDGSEHKIAQEIIGANTNRRDRFLNDSRFLADDWSDVKQAIERDPDLRHAFGLDVDGPPRTIHETSGRPYCEDHDCDVQEHAYKPKRSEVQGSASRISGNTSANADIPGAGNAGGQIGGQHERTNQSTETYSSNTRGVCADNPKCRQNLWGFYVAVCNETNTEIWAENPTGERDREFNPTERAPNRDEEQSSQTQTPEDMINTLKGTNRDLADDNETLRATIEERKETRQQFEENIQQLAAHNKELKEKKYQRMLDNRDLKTDELERDAEHDDTIDDNDATIEDIEETISDNNQRIEKMSDAVSDIEEELATKRHTLAANEKQIAENEAEIETITGDESDPIEQHDEAT